MDLQRETQALLQSIRADATAGTRRYGGVERKTTAVSGKAGARKKRGGKEAAAVASTMELAQSPIKPRLKLGRETVEVLDTASNPASVRGDEETNDAERPQSAGPTAETLARDMSFEAEEERQREVRLCVTIIGVCARVTTLGACVYAGRGLVHSSIERRPDAA
jgi:hypothetical protein